MCINIVVIIYVYVGPCVVGISGDEVDIVVGF